MAECREPAPCPACGASSPKVLSVRADQIGINTRCLRDPFQTTHLKQTMGRGDWENAVRAYKRWDGPYPGESPGATLPNEQR